MDLKKAYYYIICLAALYFLFWGAVDLTGSAIGLLTDRVPPALPEQPNEQALDTYYQKNVLVDRLWDGALRLVLAGGVFIYCRRRADA